MHYVIAVFNSAGELGAVYGDDNGQPFTLAGDAEKVIHRLEAKWPSVAATIRLIRPGNEACIEKEKSRQ